ncbi:MAG TPA: tetratricopeptide repeat protein [Rhodopila sp.]|nr:tetratricopeptide repeat protein [Rhodopila sp.]
MRAASLIMLLMLAACGITAADFSPEQANIDTARAALRGGAPQIALQIIASSLQRHPHDQAALIVRGDALTAQGRYDEAQLAYRDVLRVNPESPGALLGLGRIELASDPAAAESMFLAALRHDPRNASLLNDLGVARDLQHHHAAAQDAYHQALGLDPQSTGAIVNLALSVAMTGHGDEAVRMLRPLASNPTASPKLRHDLAAALAMAGHREEAAHILSADLSPAEVRQAVAEYSSASVKP